MASIASRSVPVDEQNIPAGIGLMLFGFFLFSANDALGKWMAATYTPGQILLFRSATAMVVLVPFVLRAGVGSLFALERPWLHALRLMFATTEVFFFYWAVSGLPLADTMTYYLASPIYVTVLAALLLKERVGWRRWSAVAVGFLGVLIAVRPVGAINIHVLIAFIGSLLFSGFLVVTRTLRGATGLNMATWQIVTALVAGAGAAPIHWVPIADGTDYLLLCLLGVGSLLAIVCVNRSLQLAPASVVVPYQYTLIVWAVLFGYLLFGDLPTWRVAIGAAIIVAAGLYIFFREQTWRPSRRRRWRRGREASLAPAAPCRRGGSSRRGRRNRESSRSRGCCGRRCARRRRRRRRRGHGRSPRHRGRGWRPRRRAGSGPRPGARPPAAGSCRRAAP